MDNPPMKLFCLFAEWMDLSGNNPEDPFWRGMVHAETDLYEIQFNRSKDTVDTVPPFSAHIQDKAFPDHAIINMFSGVAAPGMEIKLIEHFELLNERLKQPTLH